MLSDFELVRILADLGSAALMALLVVFLLRYLDKRDARTHEDDSRQDEKQGALIETIKALAEYITIQTSTLTEINTKIATVPEMGQTLASMQEMLNNADVVMANITRSREQRFDELAEAVNAVPERVQELLKDDLESMGNRLSEIVTSSREFYLDAKTTLSDWVSLTARVQRLFDNKQEPRPVLPVKTNELAQSVEASQEPSDEKGQADG